MTARPCVALLLVLLVAPPAHAQSPTPAGRVKLVSGSAFVVHEGSRIPAAVGTPAIVRIRPPQKEAIVGHGLEPAKRRCCRHGGRGA